MGCLSVYRFVSTWAGQAWRGKADRSSQSGKCFLSARLSSMPVRICSHARAAVSYSIPYINGYQMLLGGILLCTVSCWQSGLFPFLFDLQSALMLLHLAIVSAVGFMLWNNIMKYNQVGSVSMYLFLIPVFGVFQSAILLSEPLSIAVLAALMLVSLGIIIVNRNKGAVKPADN